MSTLIAAYNGEGKCIGKCDAKCYEAQEPDCNCICGGANHGKGKNIAIENTRLLADKWLADYKEANPEFFTAEANIIQQYELITKEARK